MKGDPSKTNITLISNPNGLEQITDITNGSVHLSFSPSNCTVSLFINRVGINLKVISYDRTCLLDGKTVYEFGYEISGNDIIVYTPDGKITTVTDERVPEYKGRYCTFEYYWEKYDKARPVFTEFNILNGEDVILYDDFNRGDGNIGIPDTGNTYIQLHENL